MNTHPLSYCGLYCPQCYKMRASKAAEILHQELASAKDRCGAKAFLTPEFQKSLRDLIALRCPKVCKNGGGNPQCQIRKCCISKKYQGCWECGDFKICDKLKGQYIKNIKRIIKIGADDYIKEKTSREE